MTVKLIAERIEFTKFSIVYHVRLKQLRGRTPQLFGEFPVFCPNDITEKDLILKPTLISNDSMIVVYTPSNVTCEFYQRVMDKTIKNSMEYQTELKYIYGIGDVVGCIVV